MERESLVGEVRTERAGIRVWWAELPGRFMAALCFRVGRADELLSTAGATHLVEHLALFAVGRRDHGYNGFVDDTRCVFLAEGERDEVLEFLRLVADGLTHLPVDRIELERRVLRAEASRADSDGGRAAARGQLRLYARSGAWMHATPFIREDGYIAVGRMRERIPAHALVPAAGWALADAIAKLRSG